LFILHYNENSKPTTNLLRLVDTAVIVAGQQFEKRAICPRETSFLAFASTARLNQDEETGLLCGFDKTPYVKQLVFTVQKWIL